MKNKQKTTILMASTLPSIWIQTKSYQEINPNLKFGLGLSLGILLSMKEKTRTIGKGIIIGSSVGFAINKYFEQDNSFTYKSIQPQNNSILVNINSGKIIQQNGISHKIFITNKTTSESGWNNCVQLFNRIKKLKGGKPVYWNELNDLTPKFDKLLTHYINYFQSIKSKFNDPISKYQFWISMVNDHEPLDLKNGDYKPSKIGEWSILYNTLVRYDDYGNILYGAAGRAFGFSEELLIIGANLNQITKTGFDEEKDTESIKRGINIYNNRFATTNN